MMRLVRALLLAYPEEARRRYGDDILATIADRVRQEARTGGRLAAAALYARECAGVMAAGGRLRLARVREQRARERANARLRARRATLVDGIVPELRVAARGLLRQPGFTLVAVLALALGIGATVAIFSVFHAVLLRPLPFREPARLVSIWATNPERGWHRAQVAAANYLDWREQAESFRDMAAYNDWFDEHVLIDGGEPVVVFATEVTGNFFDVLGVVPAEGRGFDDRHTWAGPEPAAVLSHGFWSRQFGGDLSVLGRTIALDGVAHRVLGIMPEGFAYPFRDADLWIPVAWEPELRAQTRFRRAHGMRVVGRLADGASLEEAESELAAIAARLERDHPETNQFMGTGVTPLHEWIVGDASRPLEILMVVVGLVLLIACANVSNMLLARTNTRQDELRIRSALGGARSRLALQGLVESMMLALVGGSLGLVLGVVSIRPLLRLSPEGLPRIDEIAVDASVIVFAVVLSLLTGLLFGSVPAWRGASAGLAPSARGATSGRTSRRASGLLVAAEIALTLPLVVGAGLMVRTLAELSSVAPGFEADGVVVAKVMAPPARYESDEAVARFYRQLLDDVRGIPGVEAAAMSSRLPFGNSRWSSDFTVDGWPPERFGIGVRHDEITEGLFETMGVPLLRGRDVARSDDAGATPVVLINRALAERYFADEDPIGKRVTFDRTPDASSTWRTIVGVVGNVRRESLSVEETPSFYAPVYQDTTRQLHLLLASEREPRSLVARAQERLDAIDPTLPLFDVTTLEAELSASVARERYLLVLLALAAGIALALASIGIFGVVSYATSRRVREIGIRMALGARESAVIALIVRGGLKPVIAGAVVGVIAAGIMAHAMSSFLFEVQPLDPMTFTFVLVVVVGAALLACVVPARRATRVDASSALRTD